MKKVKGFTYDTEKDKDVIEYIEKQPNQSRYIWNLVRQDMNKNSLENLVRQYVEEILKEKNIKLDQKSITKNDIVQLLNIR